MASKQMASKQMPLFQQKYGSWALITGASSGIGAEFARQLAPRGMNLILVARREERLQQLAEQLRSKHAIEVMVIAADLSTPDFLQVIATQTQQCDIGLLVNNAGFALTGAFLDHSLEHELALLHVNCRAPLMLAHYFGRLMVRKKRGGIINICSASAFMPLPFWTNYSAAKSYCLQFSEGLWFELKKHGVDVLAVCPGSTKTEFASVAGTSAQGVEVAPLVTTILNNLGKKPTLIPGFGNQAAAFVARFLSRKLAILLGSKVIGER
ncbi:MAG: SDR family oxidoreductase [Pseudomonadota bacterium]